MKTDRVPKRRTLMGRFSVRDSMEGKRWCHFRPGITAWAVASLVASVVPYLLYFLYASFPAARPWIALGHDGPIEPKYGPKGEVRPPIFGFPPEGVYLSLFLMTVLVYWLVGAGICIRKGPPAESKGWGPPHLIPAIAALFFTIPLLAATIPLTLKAERFPDFSWEIFGAKGAPSESLIIVRRVMNLAVFFPQLSAALCVMSFIIEPSRSSVVLAAIAFAAFVILALYLNYLGG